MQSLGIKWKVKPVGKGKRKGVHKGKTYVLNQFEKPKRFVVKVPKIFRFRKDNNNGHWHMILDSVDDKYVSMGVTKDKYKGKGHPNYDLKCSVFNNGKNSYLRREVVIKGKNSYQNEKFGLVRLDRLKYAEKRAKKKKEEYLISKKIKK